MKRVLLGMSGGVDSSAAAALLLEQGYDVTGLTLDLVPNGGAAQMIADARTAARQLGIPHMVLELHDLFGRAVIQPFVDAYLHGRTPNPCIFCNQKIKFGAMLEKALEFGMDYFATGHYARVSEENGQYFLKVAAVPEKDQSYVLYGLTQQQLSHTLLPLGAYSKEQVRAIAEKAGMAAAKKKDSQEICFVPDNDYAAFIAARAGRLPPPGEFVDMAGNVLGQHRGLIHYTIGQRKGLGIALGQPMFVTAIDAANNRVVLGRQGSEYAGALIAEQVNYIAPDTPTAPFVCDGRIRYNGKTGRALVTPLSGGSAKVEFETPVRAITPGQAVVFYQGDTVLGGGTIVKQVSE